jgi:hypothetical protein
MDQAAVDQCRTEAKLSGTIWREVNIGWSWSLEQF